MVLADIASGNADLADVSFLVALILFAIAGVVAALRLPQPWFHSVLIAAGLALIALGFLVL